MFRALGRKNLLERSAQRLFSSSSKRKPLESASKLSVGDKIHGYTVKGVTAVPDFDLVAVELAHDQTRAQHLHLARDDTNNAFGVGFCTTPMDNTGVAHVLEHTVLCGSKKFPVRDPFFKMLNRSLATFMNAFTANDWTLYPFCTQNEKDYYNLMSVYLDCVFHPLLKEMDFRQEGWRLEHENPKIRNTPIVFKGIVFNEMKGVFANPENMYAQTMQNKLFPNHTYSHVSGGDPVSILDLSWEKLKEFHATHYHPSNSRFFTYGDLHLVNHLKYIDSEVLQHFQESSSSLDVPMEPRWNKPMEHCISCPMDSLTGDKAFVGVSFLLSDITDPYESLVLQILCQLLVDGPSSPFYQALIESQIGTQYTPNTGYDNSTKEASFSVGIQGVKYDDIEKVKEIIWCTMEKVESEGFPEECIRAALHQIELGLKHQTRNFGLSLMVSLISPWIHGGVPTDMLQVNHNIKKFKEDCQDPQYLKKLIRHFFLDNKHRVILVMKPNEKLTTEREEEELKKLDHALTLLSKHQKEEIYDAGLNLLSYQDTSQSPKVLPAIKLSDIDEKISYTYLDHDHVGGVPVQFCQQPTNGITYFQALSGFAVLPETLKIYVPLFCHAMTQMGTENYDHRQFAQQCDMYTGGLVTNCHVSTYHDSLQTLEQAVHFSSHCLEENLPYMLNLWEELFCSLTLHDANKLRTIINIASNNLAMSVANSGHLFAIFAASAGLSPAANLSERLNGITQVSLLKELSNLEDLSEVLLKLGSIGAEVLDCGSFRCAINCSNKTIDKTCKAISGFIATLPGKSADLPSLFQDTGYKEYAKVQQFDFGFPVNYVGHSIKTVPYQDEDSPRLDILARLMDTKFLHKEVREKGGAYGSGTIHKGGIFSFYSYRDPNSYATLDTYERCLKWAMEGLYTDDDINEARVSLLSKMDYPVPPGSRGYIKFLHHLTDEMRQEYRQRIFHTQKDHLVTAASRYFIGRPCGSAIIGGKDMKN